MEKYILDSQEIENIIDRLGFAWEDVFDDYEEFYENIEEVLRDSFKHCKLK